MTATSRLFRTIRHQYRHWYPELEILFNLTDARIVARDGATGNVANNIMSASSGMFVDPANNDLHLRSTAALVIDAASVHPDVTDDFDGQPRPVGLAPDIGADEYSASSPPPTALVPAAPSNLVAN